MMPTPVPMLLLTILMAGSPQTRSFADMTSDQIDAYLGILDAENMSFHRRILKISEKFLGVAYADSPLGEGEGNQPDTDPLIRFNAVDCTTFLEQTIAMAHASNLKEALYVLQRVRYRDGVIDYAERKHFMMAQWFPLNQKEGFLRDITRQVGGEVVRWEGKRLDRATWERRRRRGKYPQLTHEQIPTGFHRIAVMPIDRARELADGIPAGTILSVVRNDFRSIPIRVSHQGLVVVRRGRRYLRHAARAGYGRVVDELLDTFLRRNQAYRKWPVSGVNLQRILRVKGIQK
jgi:hypothetical protein